MENVSSNEYKQANGIWNLQEALKLKLNQTSVFPRAIWLGKEKSRSKMERFAIKEVDFWETKYALDVESFHYPRFLS